MARRCDFSGQGTTKGNNRSHSNRATKREFRVNLFRKKYVDPRTGQPFWATVSARAIRTLTKNPAKILVLAKKVVGRIAKSQTVVEMKAEPKAAKVEEKAAA